MRGNLALISFSLIACNGDTPNVAPYVEPFQAAPNYVEKRFSDGEGRLLVARENLRAPFELGCAQDSFAPPCDGFENYRWDVRIDDRGVRISFTHRHRSVLEGKSGLLYGFSCTSSESQWTCVVGQQ